MDSTKKWFVQLTTQLHKGFLCTSQLVTQNIKKIFLKAEINKICNFTAFIEAIKLNWLFLL